MKNFARIINNIAVDVSSDPGSQFHPDLAGQFEPVTESVQQGWIRNELGEWGAPSQHAESVQAATATEKVSPVEFKLLFSSAERVAIKAARDTDPVIDDFYDIVEDPRLTHVDLGLKSTKDALAYMANTGLIAAERQGEILAGKMQ